MFFRLSKRHCEECCVSFLFLLFAFHRCPWCLMSLVPIGYTERFKVTFVNRFIFFKKSFID